MGCCSNNTENKIEIKTDFTCPKCDKHGVAVEVITPQTLLMDEPRGHVRTDSNYKFCKNPTCEVAYYTQDSSHYFSIAELKEKATLKDRGLDVKVCYCFGHTRQSILTELQTTGNSSALEDVKSKMKDPGCFCERSNPQGGCCLGNLSSWIKEAKTNFVT